MKSFLWIVFLSLQVQAGVIMERNVCEIWFSKLTECWLIRENWISWRILVCRTKFERLFHLSYPWWIERFMVLEYGKDSQTDRITWPQTSNGPLLRNAWLLDMWRHYESVRTRGKLGVFLTINGVLFGWVQGEMQWFLMAEGCTKMNQYTTLTLWEK